MSARQGDVWSAYRAGWLDGAMAPHVAEPPAYERAVALAEAGACAYENARKVEATDGSAPPEPQAWRALAEELDACSARPDSLDARAAARKVEQATGERDAWKAAARMAHDLYAQNLATLTGERDALRARVAAGERDTARLEHMACADWGAIGAECRRLGDALEGDVDVLRAVLDAEMGAALPPSAAPADMTHGWTPETLAAYAESMKGGDTSDMIDAPSAAPAAPTGDA